MTQQAHQPPALPPHPTTDDDQAWATYRDRWCDYCEQWRIFHKQQELSEQVIDGWQENYSIWSIR